jgi:hypothetical protein
MHAKFESKKTKESTWKFQVHFETDPKDILQKDMEWIHLAQANCQWEGVTVTKATKST